MDHSKAVEWVENNIDRLMRAYGIPHWTIKVQYLALESGVAGRINDEFQYEMALIKLDPGQIADVDELERIFKHELSHIVHSPFDLFWQAVSAYIDSDKVRDSLESVFTNACELTVRNIERMHRGHRDADWSLPAESEAE